MLTLKYILLIFCGLNLVKSNPVYQRQTRQSCPQHGQSSFLQSLPNPHRYPSPPQNPQHHQQQCGRSNNFNLQASPRPASHQSPGCHQSPGHHQQSSKSCHQLSAYQKSSNGHQQQSTGCQRPNNQASANNHLGLPLNQDLGKYLVERLFSNPVFREILNKNQPVSAPLEVKQPNVVNNYFIVPKDLFINNTECIKELQRPNGLTTGGRKLDDGEVRHLIRNKAEKHLRTEKVSNPSERMIFENAQQFNYPEEYNYNKEHRERPAKAIKSKTIHKNNSTPSINGLVNKNNKTETKNDNIQNRESQRPRKSKPKEPKISFLSDEYILNDFKRKFPHIPDETAKTIITQMKEQVRKQYSNYVDTNQTPVQVGRKKSHNSETNQRNHSKARKKSKNATLDVVNNATVVPQNDTTESAIQEDENTRENDIGVLKEIDASIIDNAKEHDTTTEHYKPETSDNTTPLTINGHHTARLPELGAEDSMPNIDENDLMGETDFPDYYPNFNFDNHAYHLEALEEYANDNVQRNERTVNENHETMLNSETRPKVIRKMGRKLRRQRLGNTRHRNREQHKQTQPISKENEIVIASYSNDPDSEGEDIVFQIPPGLESPDFETIQLIAINDDNDYESNKNSREHYEKFSTYSEIKNGDHFNPVNEIRKVKVTKPRDLGNSDIETVFATSRVVNYANPNDLAFQETVTVKSNVVFAGDGFLPTEMASDGVTSLILAKAYDDNSG